MQYTYIIIDGTNLLWRSITRNIENKSNYNGGIEDFLNSLNYLIGKFGYMQSSKVYLLFDNPTSKPDFRKIVSEGQYKSHRASNKLSKHVIEVCRILIEILKVYNTNFYIAGGKQLEEESYHEYAKYVGLEADDLTKPLIDSLILDDFNKCLCISTDMDWGRNIKTNVDWYNYKEVYNVELFKNKYKFNPTGNAIKLYKSIRGDSSDNIVNAVPYLPEQWLLYIIENFSNPVDLFSILWKTDIPKKWQLKLHENQRQIMINYKLVDFLPIEEPISEYLIPCKRNEKLLKVYYKSLNIPLEESMKTKKEIKDDFLSIKNYRRVKR